MYENLIMSKSKSKSRKDPTLGTGLKIRPRWGQRKLWGSQNIFGPNKKGGVKYFWTEQGARRVFFDQTGEGVELFFAAFVKEDFPLHINWSN